MISDEQRRGAARNIRQFLSRQDIERAWDNDVLQTVGRLVETSVGENILVRLADLIDRPTCRIGYVPDSADRSCSACGVTFSTGTYQGGDHEEHEFMFCPNCGAEVKDDAEPSLKEN